MKASSLILLVNHGKGLTEGRFYWVFESRMLLKLGPMHHDSLVLFLVLLFLLAFHCSELLRAETMHTLCLQTIKKSTNSYNVRKQKVFFKHSDW